MVCCFFGHRDTPESVRPLLREEIIKLLEKYDGIMFYVGTHGSFDAMVRNTLRELKATYSHLRYNVVLAYLPVERAGAEDTYEDTIYPEGLENVPKRFAISARNKWMVDRADIVVCYVTKRVGGAAQFVDLAERKGKRIVNLANI